VSLPSFRGCDWCFNIKSFSVFSWHLYICNPKPSKSIAFPDPPEDTREDEKLSRNQLNRLPSELAFVMPEREAKLPKLLPWSWIISKQEVITPFQISQVSLARAAHQSPARHPTRHNVTRPCRSGVVLTYMLGE